MLTLILLSVGITHVWARGTIFRRARLLWPALLDCPLCAGVWISFCVQLGGVYAPTLTVAVGVACLSASLSLALYGLIRAIPVRSNQPTSEASYLGVKSPTRGGPRPMSAYSSEDAAYAAWKGRGYT